MDFACLRCRAHVRVALGASGRELAEIDAVPRRESGGTEGNATETRENETTAVAQGEREPPQEHGAAKKQDGGAGKAGGSDAATRCRRCDGLYHTSCVVEVGVATQAFECMACLRGDTSDDTNEEAGMIPALLLPLAALGLVDGKAIAPAAMDEEEDEEDDWVVFTETIDVCTACRQVHLEWEDRAPCAECHADGRLHRRCLGVDQANTLSAPTPPSPKMSRLPGRKRKRSTSASTSRESAAYSSSGGALAAACSSCQGQRNAAPCAIESRRLALLVKKGDRVWWDVCVSCRRDFCLHALVEDGEVEEDSLRSRFGRNLASGFQCQACCEAAAGNATKSVTEASVAFCDQSTLFSVEATLGVDPLMEEEGTVLLCDGCEGEFEMARLDPPLLEVPEGDWFCASCQTIRNQQHQEHLDGDAQLVTLLICDGCENEFDMAAIQPPLVAVPEGDWFCNSCVVPQDAEDDDQTTVSHAEAADPITESPDEASTTSAELVPTTAPVTKTSVVTQPPPSTSEESSPPTTAPAATTRVSESIADGVTLVECDGCDDKFDVATIRPAAPEVPKGDWFCDTCEATRKRRKKGYVAMKLEKARRLKAMGLDDSSSSTGVTATPKPVIPRLQPEPRVRVEPRRLANLGLPPSTTVTLLICDGCEGEYDMATLNPPLSSVPRGNWFCSTCVGARRKPSSSASMMPCETCSCSVRWNRDAQRAARRRGDMSVLCEPCVLAKAKASVPPPIPEIVRDDKKRKRVQENAVQHDGRMQVDPVERIFAPVPVSVNFSSASISNGSGSSAAANTLQTTACGHVVCSEDEGDGISDHDDDHIIIVCEICLSEFNLIDVLGESQSVAPPPRPWYCMPCVRRLKKNRKKKQRISKQMMLEMQLYGGLLRPTAAKAVDPLVRALRGKKPSSEDEILSLSTLIGKRVGVMLMWDKHWVMGRILSFDLASGTHLIRFDDETEQVLPLFAFPFVISTSEIIEVMVPASRNRWWPAQVLKMNAIAESQFLATVEDPEVLRSLRLVSLFSPEPHSISLESVACWAPRHLCRAFSKAADPNSYAREEEYRLAVTRASDEATFEARVRASALRTLLQIAEDSGDDVARAVANALVGCNVAWDEKDKYTVKDFDAATGLHRVRSNSGHEEEANLFKAPEKFAVEGVETFGKLQLVLHKALRGVDTTPAEGSNQDTEPLDIELAVLPSSTSIRPSPASSSDHCKKCSLPPVVDGETGAFAGEKSLVQCIACDNAFHSYCCDPPHDKFPLVSREDGSILVEDIKTGFVCRECVTCAGCNTSSSSRWFRWRLPLQVVSLCENCIGVYDSKCQCAVCNIAFDDVLLDDSAALLKCTSCDLWVHPQCEPDSHPAFRRRTQQDGFEFELDLQIPLPDLSIKHNDHEDDGDEECLPAPGKATLSSGGAVSKSARLADEERAFELHFKDSYDARVLNNYECLCCRKVRLLRVLYRLRLEDKLDLFKDPVTKLIAPTYFDVIKQPMDLATMQQKVLDNVYKRVNFRDFRDDFELLCLNAVTFNSRDRDFLIWREAWRFYGQGQKILRQIAPKTRMKRRGGKHYDALVFAAKRQLPNNSQLGKTKLGAGSDVDDDDGDDDDDDEDEDPENESTETDLRDESELEVGSEFGVQDGVSNVLEQNTVTVPAPSGEKGTEVTAVTTKLESNGVSSTESSLSTSKSALDKKRALSSNTGVSFTPQSELGLAPKPHSVLQFYLTMHSRSGAHTYCWVDACGICGTRGSQDEDLLFCVDCGEGFHTFCCGVDEKKFLSVEHPIHTYWRCANCEMCELCGKPHDKEAEEEEENRRMQCKNCDRSFHGKCLLPAIGSEHDFGHPDESGNTGQLSLGEFFYCASCVACKCCKKTQPRASYSNDREMCLSCSHSQKSEQSLMSAKTKDLLQVWATDTRRQRKDAEKCPMCREKWTTEDADLIQCDACECWAHPRCDPVFVEDPTKYQDLVNDPNAQYVCSACRSHERTHLKATPHLAKCQLFLAKIQRTRSLCDARWVEARAQMRQAQIWNEWKDNLAIYLYVLRIGEECLKNLAYRSVNFQDDWARRSAKHQDASIPTWLFQKAARYLRYKRYARGPRAAARKLTRKAENFYSQQGIDKQKEPHAIATVASQASSCAALIVCVQLLYGWAPLQRVVFHLLEREEGHLSPSLVKSLLVDNHETLEEEIENIKNQYERRAGKKHLLRLQAEDGEGDDTILDEEISPTGSSTSSVGPDFSGPDAKPNSEGADVPSRAEDAQPQTPTLTQIVRLKRPTIRMTRAQPLGAARGIVSEIALPGSPPTVEDNRYCSLCFIVGDSPACGRLVYVELDQWVHMNCALWSSEVYEDANGTLQRCQRALSRSKTNRCDGCGVLGATLGCCVSRCPRHYHLPCALDRGVVFLPNGETCCPVPSHVQQVTKKFQLLDPLSLDPESSQNHHEAHTTDEPAVVTEPITDESQATYDGALIEKSDTTSAAAVEVSAPPPQWSPLVKEPRHCVRVDFSSIFTDTKKRMNALHLKRQICFRIGALTVHSLGHVVIGNPSFYSRDAVYPLGFRSTRVYWSTRHLAIRCVYECVVTSTEVESRKSANGKDAQDRRFLSPKALFKITASDDKENPIVASSPMEALLELRSRVVSLYEEARCFASAEENPFLNRRSWFSYGLLGHHFFGFGIPEIAQEIETLPHVATTAIRRRYILHRHRQHQNQRKRRRGQEVFVDEEEAKAGDHVYVFSHRLPPAAEMALAIREVEQVVEAEEHARMSSGAVRTDGLDRQVDEEEEAALRATRRRLNKDATRDSHVQLPLEKVAQPASSAPSSGTGGNDAAGDTTTGGAKEKQAGVPMDLEHLPIAMQYRELRRRPFSERLEVLKSKIHGYGLFTKEKFVEGQMIVEYQGQMISQAVADVREKQYEEMGIGSCYMFRLDERTIIDATRCGNLARFMNHSCDPKAFARVVVVENNEKKIVIFAKRTIEAFEEVTYDYKFPIEDEAIRCDCGAFNCIGRMN